MTDYLTSTTKADLDALAAKVDAATGYPKPGVNVGKGIHVPAAMGVTQRYAAVRKHPDSKVTQFAYPVDATVAAVLNAVKAQPVKDADEQKIDALAAPAKLDATWTPKDPLLSPKEADGGAK